jgi:hypothetical protein
MSRLLPEDGDEWDDEQGVPDASASTALVTSLKSTVSTASVTTQMIMLQSCVPAVQLCLRSLPDSARKQRTLNILDTWNKLYHEGSIVSPPNVLHLAYVSAIMSRLVLREL